MSDLIQRATVRNRNLPRNGRDRPVGQLFSNEVRLVTISPNGAHGHYDAVVDGELVVKSSLTPFCDAARVLVERGVDTNSWIVMRHQGSDVDALRSKVGIAAKLTVREDRDAPRFVKYAPWKAPEPREGSPPMRQTGRAATPIAEAAQ
jgi:hypothetical protein